MKDAVAVKQQTKTQSKSTKCPDCRSYNTGVERTTPGNLKRLMLIMTMQPITSTKHYRCFDCGTGWTMKQREKK